MKIGELGERVGVTPKTIRYYEELGLIPPPDRAPSGYRAYGKEAAARLRFIKAAQSIGLTLGEIRETLAFRDRGEMPCAHVTALIERHAEDLSERIAALERMRRDLERLARKARRVSPREAERASFCHIIEAVGRGPPRGHRGAEGAPPQRVRSPARNVGRQDGGVRRDHGSLRGWG
ncbi:MAG: heavy metal-responsive transcriptional regulator [Actinomycetota bacterium]